MKTKALISCAVTAQLICAFDFAYLKVRFSHDEAQLRDTVCSTSSRLIPLPSYEQSDPVPTCISSSDSLPTQTLSVYNCHSYPRNRISMNQRHHLFFFFFIFHVQNYEPIAITRVASKNIYKRKPFTFFFFSQH